MQEFENTLGFEVLKWAKKGELTGYCIWGVHDQLLVTRVFFQTPYFL